MLRSSFQVLQWWLRSPLVRVLWGAGGVWLLLLLIGGVEPAAWREGMQRGMGSFVWFAMPFLVHELMGGTRGALLFSRPLARAAVLSAVGLGTVEGWGLFLFVLGLPAEIGTGAAPAGFLGLLWLELMVYTLVVLVAWLWTRRVYVAIGLNLFIYVLDAAHERALVGGKGWPLLEYLLPAGNELSRLVYAWPAEEMPDTLALQVLTSSLLWLGLALWRIRTMEV